MWENVETPPLSHAHMHVHTHTHHEVVSNFALNELRSCILLWLCHYFGNMVYVADSKEPASESKCNASEDGQSVSRGDRKSADGKQGPKEQTHAGVSGGIQSAEVQKLETAPDRPTPDACFPEQVEKHSESGAEVQASTAKAAGTGKVTELQSSAVTVSGDGESERKRKVPPSPVTGSDKTQPPAKKPRKPAKPKNGSQGESMEERQASGSGERKEAEASEPKPKKPRKKKDSEAVKAADKRENLTGQGAATPSVTGTMSLGAPWMPPDSQGPKPEDCQGMALLDSQDVRVSASWGVMLPASKSQGMELMRQNSQGMMPTSPDRQGMMASPNSQSAVSDPDALGEALPTSEMHHSVQPSNEARPEGDSVADSSGQPESGSVDQLVDGATAEEPKKKGRKKKTPEQLAKDREARKKRKEENKLKDPEQLAKEKAEKERLRKEKKEQQERDKEEKARKKREREAMTPEEIAAEKARKRKEYNEKRARERRERRAEAKRRKENGEDTDDSDSEKKQAKKSYERRNIRQVSSNVVVDTTCSGM